MADISNGPVSTMPGALVSLPDNTMCDIHSNRLAVARVQGETDSFGCEYNDCCQECLDEINRYAKEGRSGTCDWCHSYSSDLRDTRDYDEGFSGRIYQVCLPCRNDLHKSYEEEWDRMDDWDYYYD